MNGEDTTRDPAGTGREMGEIHHADDGSVTVRFERLLRHPPERVWAALTRPEEVVLWFTAMTLDARPGGEVHLDFGEQGEARGEVLELTPPSILVHTWIEKGHESRVRWEVRPSGDGTLLRLTHTSLAPESAHEYGAGWHDFLDRLPHHLDGRDLSGWVDRYSELLEEYARPS